MACEDGPEGTCGWLGQSLHRTNLPPRPQAPFPPVAGRPGGEVVWGRVEGSGGDGQPARDLLLVFLFAISVFARGFNLTEAGSGARFRAPTVA